MGKLERKIDQDLVDRMLAGWKPKPDEKKSRKRTARRSNSGKPAVKRRPFTGQIRLNRSKKWKPVATYAEARAQRAPLAAE